MWGHLHAHQESHNNAHSEPKLRIPFRKMLYILYGPYLDVLFLFGKVKKNQITDGPNQQTGKKQKYHGSR